MQLLNTSIWREIRSIKLSGSSHRKVFLLLEKKLGTNASLWSSVCLLFWIFDNFFEDFCDVYERVEVSELQVATPTLSSPRSYFELSKFWCEVLAIINWCLRINTGETMVKDWWHTVFSPNKYTDFWLQGENNYLRKLCFKIFL